MAAVNELTSAAGVPRPVTSAGLVGLSLPVFTLSAALLLGGWLGGWLGNWWLGGLPADVSLGARPLFLPPARDVVPLLVVLAMPVVKLGPLSCLLYTSPSPRD